MKQAARLSVGIPAYNQGRFLANAIESLLNQVTPPFEIVVSNNHSQDDTAQVIEQYAGVENLKSVGPSTHLPMTEHWNFVASQLSGDWITLLSSDDAAKPTFVAALLSGIASAEDPVLVRAGWEEIDLEGALLEEHLLLSVPRIVRPPRTLTEQIRGTKGGFISFALKREAWAAVGGFPTECQLSADWGMWIRVSPLGDFVYVNECISQFRRDYRPGLTKTRFPRTLADDDIIQGKLIPDAALAIGGISARTLYRHERAQFRRRLREASLLYQPDERQQIAAQLSIRAARTRSARYLARFESGGLSSVSAWRLRARRVARSLWQSVHHTRPKP